MRKCVFLDRDGVINQCPGDGYVLKWENFHFNPGIMDAFKIIWSAGYEAVVITNQNGVGKGLMTMAGLQFIHEQMSAEILRQSGKSLLAIKAWTDGNLESELRKPKPGLILAALAEHHLDASQSWMIGDQDKDIQCAWAAGIPNTIRILGNRSVEVQATHTIASTHLLPATLSHCLSVGV